jgi:hypothetical protein
MPRHLRSTAFCAVAAVALMAGPAAAKDFCTVGIPGCNASPNGVQGALDAAAANDGPDRVLIGSGMWVGNFHASGDVTIQGSPDGTALRQSNFGSGAGDPFTLTLSGAGAVVRDLRIALPTGYGPRGLALQAGASAEKVTVDGAGAAQATGVALGTSARFSGSVDLPEQDIAATMGAGSGIIDARIAGGPAVLVQAGGGGALIRRSTIVRRNSSAVTAISGALTIEDTLIDARAPGPGAALSTYADPPTGAHSVDLRNVTMLGHGDEQYSFGIHNIATVGDAATVTARDTVVANFGSNALFRGGPGTANLSLDHVDVFPASAAQGSGPGALTTTAVTNADPGFAADGFTPAAGSPLIDAGRPGPLGSDESATDLAGNPRVVAFGCGDAVRDLGAIEAVGSCAPPAPAPAPGPGAQPAPSAADATAPRVTKLRIARRRSVRFSLSEAARVTVRVARAHRKAIVLRRAAGGGTVSLRLKRMLRHGRYTIHVIAVDGAGNRSAPAILRKKV